MNNKFKTLLPGVVMRTGRRERSLRFSCMVKGVRYTKTLGESADLWLDERGKATMALKAEYNQWVARCLAKSGRVPLRGVRIPTIRELIDAYEVIARERSRDPNFGRPSERAIRSAIMGYRYCVEESGLAWDTGSTALMAADTIRRIFEGFSSRMKGISAWTYIQTLQTVTAKWTAAKYRELGYRVAQPEMPDVGKAKKAPEYKMLSQEQKDRIAKWYAGLAGADDRRLFLAASIVAQLAVRPNDVGRLTAENFRADEDDGRRMHLVYTPNKTRESSNRRVDWPIGDALWRLIREVGGKRLDAGETLLEAPKSVFNRLNASMREACGMGDWNKAVYELRKLCIDTVRRIQGVDAAVALSGDRRETIDVYYSDPYKLTGIKPLEVLPMG